MKCKNCNIDMRTTYIRKRINGSQTWRKIGSICDNCDLFITKDQTTSKPQIPSYDEVYKLLKRKSLDLPNIYGYLEERASRRDKNVVRMFYLFLLREVFELEI